MSEVKLFFVALLLSFIFCAPDKLVAQEHGVCQPISKVCPAIEVGGRVDKKCYEKIAYDILSNSSRCADSWLTALSVRDKQILALINASDPWWPVDNLEKFEQVDKVLRFALGRDAEEMMFANRLRLNDFKPITPASEHLSCPGPELYLADCPTIKAEGKYENKEGWAEQEWLCFLNEISYSSLPKNAQYEVFKSAPPAVLSKILQCYNDCVSHNHTSHCSMFDAMIKDVLKPDNYAETIVGVFVANSPQGPALSNHVFLPDNEAAPRFIEFTSRADGRATFWLVKYQDIFSPEQRFTLHLYAPEPCEEKNGYYRQLAGKVEYLEDYQNHANEKF